MVSVESIVVGPLETNCYLVCSDASCIIIDPGDETGKILRPWAIGMPWPS
ncbi:MBL fold metallo-hydrolase [Vulcanisaeta sp. JCM 14467]|nr:MBL fold metallo-hydrolase [Vulcanisaeta sp. JCM 14467]